MANLEGVGKDAPKGEQGGGQQSLSPYRFDLLPPLALAATAKVLARGAATYGERTWMGITVDSQLNKALQHIYAFLAGDETEEDGDPVEHLRHASCRILFALELKELARQGIGFAVESTPGSHADDARVYMTSPPTEDIPVIRTNAEHLQEAK